MSLKGFNNICDQTLNNELQDNLIEYFDWHLLDKANYFNIELNEQSYSGHDYSLLQITNSSTFEPGEAWDGFRKNWVWQSGVDPSGFAPPLVGTNDDYPGIEGVYVDDTFYPCDVTGPYAHNVDYFNGRVIFDNPIPTNSKVQAEFSYKYINVIYATSVPWLREFYFNTLDPSSRESVSIPPEMQIQLPAIAVEIVPQRTMKPYELGALGQFVDTDVLFHCIAEDDMTRNKLVDIVSMQNDSIISMFDTNLMAEARAFPINSYGYPVAGALRYPDLVSNFAGNSFLLKDVNVQVIDMINSNLHAGVVRFTTEYITTTF